MTEHFTVCSTTVGAIGIWDSSDSDPVRRPTGFTSQDGWPLLAAASRLVAIRIGVQHAGVWVSILTAATDPLPKLGTYSRSPQVYGVEVPSGIAHIGGLQNLFHPSSPPNRFASSVPLAPGHYQAEFFVRDQPADQVMQAECERRRAALTPHERRVYDRRETAGYIFAAVVITTATIAIITRFHPVAVIAGLVLVSIVAAILFPVVGRRLGLDVIDGKLTDDLRSPLYVIRLTRVETPLSGGMVDLHPPAGEPLKITIRY
jgi:hypothetical protein